MVYFLFAKRVVLPKGSHNPCGFRMDKKTLSRRNVEEKKRFPGDGMPQALKAELMACLSIDKRVKA
ncbi:MAG: hypothetical protein JZU65_10985 [Chlorobium sp.]|nr:hypothetical protein [Chlorobium sp.]